MHRSYYHDNDPASTAGREPAPAWEPGERPGPYGEVPGAPAPLPYIPARETPAGGGRKRRGRANGLAGFALFLVLVLLLAGGAVLLRGAVGPDISLEDIWDHWQGRDDWEDWDGPWEEDEDDWLSDLPKTTAQRAPLGTGVTLPVTAGHGESLTPQEIYQKVNPAVVQVRSYLRNGYSLGTGVVMTDDGYIVTNAHVIAGARQIDVIFPDSQRVRTRLVGYDGETDLAVIKVEGTGILPAEFGDSAELAVGDPAYAIGNPLGDELRGTFTDGIISAIDRSVSTDEGEQTLLQTTAALNSGNSGGALINRYGQVIGITNMKMMSEYETIEGLGFAIPTSVVKPVVDQLIERGEYLGQPMLGVMVYAVESEGDRPAGLLVDSVDRDLDAYRQGVEPGDIILSANGERVTTVNDLLAVKNALGIGDTLTLELWRQGETLTVTVRLIGSREV